MKKINYISEINLPGNSGYIHHVLKICDAFSNLKKTKLFVFSKSVKFSNLKSNYLLKTKFTIKKFSDVKKKISFLDRIHYAIFIKKNVDKKSIIISRSLVSSMLLSILKKKNIVELHHPPTGLTNLIFFIFRFFKLDKNLGYIFLHKNLKKKLRINKGLILDDGVDCDDFKKIREKEIKTFCYVGSLFKGKGIETILKLAKKFPNEKFHIYGDKNTLEKRLLKDQILIEKNILFNDFKSYKDIPKILKFSKFLLLPYSKKVFVNSNSLEVSSYMSPLKMFDYLAAGKIILASNLDVYSHILKNNFNCYLTTKNEEKYWIKLVQKVLNKSDFKDLKKNAVITAKKYSWNNRVRKILKYSENL